MQQAIRVEIRRLQAHDVPAVLEIQLHCHDAARLESARSFDAKLAASPASCFMAWVDGRPAGYLVAIPVKAGRPPPLNSSTCPVPPAADALYLHDLAVHPDARGAGVAVALVQAFFDAVGSLGLSQACLTAVNGSAGFWERQGFRRSALDAGESDGMATYGDGAQYMSVQVNRRAVGRGMRGHQNGSHA